MTEEEKAKRQRRTPAEREQALLEAVEGRRDRAVLAKGKAVKDAADAEAAKTAAEAELDAARKALVHAQGNPDLPKPAATS